ncbi:response regulator transcription factor [Duganella sp. LX20W]|uniref:Response regulator transcription factor n=1 Tax=Rugamonas brunnea TaxID=2758569 RepID=A0A7W2IEJ2_9BURK|nr:response regulator transcription factor [Rugamonas brunnea]MBA5640122.1 response regulator transcription factor [Rugamonas brunnea]
MQVLLIEDDALIGESVRQALVSEDIDVEWRRDGAGAEQLLDSGAYDAVLLDLSLPSRDGLDVLQALRAARHDVPVLILTARDTVADRVQGLNAGADDYLVKPFDCDELLARVRALVRRARGRQQLAYQHNGLALDTDARQATLDGQSVALSAKEWAIIDLLVSRPGMIYSRAKIELALYGSVADVDSNVVEVHIHSLRRKLGTDAIINVRGLGYMVPKST